MSIWGSIIGGGLQYLGARDASKNALQAAQTQAASIGQASDAALAEAAPWNVGSLGGTAGFDKNNRLATLGLSPELQSIYQGALDRSGLWGDQAAQYSADPFAAADQFYSQQQDYWQPREEQMRQDAETRLLAQGRLGTTGGQRALGTVEDSILAGQQQRQTSSMSQAQALVDTLLGRESGDIGQAVGLLNVPLQQAALGRGIGGDLGSAAQTGLASRASAMTNLANTQAAAGTPLGQVGSSIGGLFSRAGQRGGAV